MTQLPRVPDTEAQRAAMRKLSFLVGKWTGEVRIFRGVGESLELVQTEEAEFKLNGLVLVIEGTGRNRADGKAALQALGMISFDDESGTFHMRAYNDGRCLETEVKLAENGMGMTWGFTLGEIKTTSVMRISELGDWTELHEIAIGSQPPRRLMEVRVGRQK
jgi:hypothetical protein